MESRGRQYFARRLLPGILGASCAVGVLFGLLNGYYLLAFSQVAIAAAMVLTFFGTEAKGKVYRCLTWFCLGVGGDNANLG
jgi:hypothetical protein